MVLLQVGFTLPVLLPEPRCALTAPFHPYQFGGLFSVALSLSSRPPGVTWHLTLRSPDFPLQPKTTAIGQLTLTWILTHTVHSFKQRQTKNAMQLSKTYKKAKRPVLSGLLGFVKSAF